MSTLFPVRSKDYIIGLLAGVITGVVTAAWLHPLLVIVLISVVTEAAFWASNKFLL